MINNMSRSESQAGNKKDAHAKGAVCRVEGRRARVTISNAPSWAFSTGCGEALRHEWSR